MPNVFAPVKGAGAAFRSAVQAASRRTGIEVGWGEALNWGLSLGMGYFDYRRYRSEGVGAVPSLLRAAGVGVMYSMLGFWPGMLVGVLPGMAKEIGASMTRGAIHQGRATWYATTPFSHRYEHTEVTARAQQLGLQAIGSAWAHSHMGSEAAAMARRYAR